MSQTGTPTEFLKLGITEPDDTLNVLVDLNGQWQKIDTGVKNVDTKANTNASGISALNTAVQDNTENITNILETNVNQQNSIDTLQSKVATLENDDESYGTRITAVEAGVQENSELINDLETDLSGVKTNMGTVPSGSTLQGQVDGLDTRVTTLENDTSVSALGTRVTTLETEVGTVPSGSTVQGQITGLSGQVNSGNIPFRFSVDGGGNYGYLKADDSFVPFQPTNIGGYNIVKVDTNASDIDVYCSCFLVYTTTDPTSYYYKKAFYIPTSELVDISSLYTGDVTIDSIEIDSEFLSNGTNYWYFDRNTNNMVQLPTNIGVCSGKNSITYYTKETNQYTLHYIDLIDSSNNVNIVISVPQDKLQSTITGRKGMYLYPYIPGVGGFMGYLTDTGYVHGIINNPDSIELIHSTTKVDIIPFHTLTSYLKPHNLLMNSTNVHIKPDEIYIRSYYKYIRIKNYCVERW